MLTEDQGIFVSGMWARITECPYKRAAQTKFPSGHLKPVQGSLHFQSLLGK